MALENSSQRSFVDPRALARLASVPLFARKAMMGNVSGRHASPHRGASVEFAEYRKYVPGDDLRRLDWRAHGRTDRYYVKEYEADTNLRCCVVVDTSGSMGFTGTHGSKIDYARRLAAAIGYLAVQQGDAVGLSGVAEGIVQSLPARRNPAHLSVYFDLLEQLKPAGETHLIGVLHELAETLRQRALVVIISDFFVEPAELKGCFEHFRFRRHDLAAFQLLDPNEIGFDFQRPTRFLDMEGGPAIFAEPSEIADRYQMAITTYLNDLKKVTVETGVDYHRISMEQTYEKSVQDFLVGRTRGGGVR